MNAFAYDLAGSPDYFEFLYDAEAKIVGLRPRSSETQFSYPVRELKSASGGTFSVSAKAFMQFYELPMERSIRRGASIADGVLCIDLNDPGVDVTAQRGRTEN